MNRQRFYQTIRQQPFPNKLTQSQVDNIEAIFNEWEQRQLQDSRWLAYMLATIYHETAFTMQPIEEIGYGRHRAYGAADPETGQSYYGRGYVQITWRDNYERFSRLLNVDLLNQPELALQPTIATQILFEGMIQGLFTGRALRHYFREESDWYNARRIINRVDRAEEIGRYARQFWYAILLGLGEVEQALLVPKAPAQQADNDPSRWLIDEVQEVARVYGGIELETQHTVEQKL